MGDAENLINEALDANRTRELLVRREARTIVSAATVVVEALGSGGTLYVLADGKLAHLARHLASTFLAADGGSPLRAVALDSSGPSLPGSPAAVRATRAFVGRGDVLLGLSLEGSQDAVAQSLELARANGAATIAISGAPGESVRARAELAIVVPSRRPNVVVESILAVGNLIERHVARRLGNETAPSFGRDPGETAELAVPQVRVSESSDAVVAELVSPRAEERRPQPSARHEGPPREASSSTRRFPERHSQAASSDERRRANRIHVRDAIVSFARDAFPEGTLPNSHALEDLSLTGMSFRVKAREPGSPEATELNVGDSLYVLIDIPAFVDKIKVQGDVRRIALLPDKTGFAVGVRFQRFLDDAQAKVRRLIEKDALRGVRRR